MPVYWKDAYDKLEKAIKDIGPRLKKVEKKVDEFETLGVNHNNELIFQREEISSLRTHTDSLHMVVAELKNNQLRIIIN